MSAGPRVGVVIPFYRTRPGLLARAVRSALAQEGVQALVVVVDDGSPQEAAVMGEFAMSAEQRAWSRNYQGEVFRSFRANLAHLARRGARIDLRQVADILAFEAKRRMTREKAGIKSGTTDRERPRPSLGPTGRSDP